MAVNEKTNRFGSSVVTSIPDNISMFSQAGHKLRIVSQIVDRSVLSNSEYQVIDTRQLIKLSNQKLKTVSHDDQQGIICLEEGGKYDKSLPNQLTELRFLTQKKCYGVIYLSSVTASKRRVVSGAISE